MAFIVHVPKTNQPFFDGTLIFHLGTIISIGTESSAFHRYLINLSIFFTYSFKEVKEKKSTYIASSSCIYVRRTFAFSIVFSFPFRYIQNIAMWHLKIRTLQRGVRSIASAIMNSTPLALLTKIRTDAWNCKWASAKSCSPASRGQSRTAGDRLRPSRHPLKYFRGHQRRIFGSCWATRKGVTLSVFPLFKHKILKEPERSTLQMNEEVERVYSGLNCLNVRIGNSRVTDVLRLLVSQKSCTRSIDSRWGTKAAFVRP